MALKDSAIYSFSERQMDNYQGDEFNGTQGRSQSPQRRDSFRSLERFSGQEDAMESIPKIENSPKLSTTSRPGDVSDLRALASANFSSDSLPDSSQNQITTSYISTTPTLGTPSINNPFGNYSSYERERRFSGSTLNSPTFAYSASPTSNVRLMRSNSRSRSRPQSAIFFGDINEESTVENIDDLYEGCRGSFVPKHASHGSKSYIPSVSVAPPIVPPSGLNSRSSSPTRGSSTRTGRHLRSKSPVRRSTSPSKPNQPFNFQPQELMLHSNGSNPSLNVKTRRGHKYKHSSVSMNLFNDPPPALSLDQQSIIPDGYPVPTATNMLSSVTSPQKLKILWSLTHILFTVIVFVTGFQFKLPSLSTLAHLMFYDALGSFVIVFVDIMSNFEVWNNSSINYPFGLGRLEVLVAFALSVSLVMVGGDLVSHFFEEFIIMLVINDPDTSHDGEQHLSHHVHGEHGSHSNWLIYELVLFGAVLVTLVTSRYILAKQKISDMMNTSEADNSCSKGLTFSEPTHTKGDILESTSSAAFWENRYASMNTFVQTFTNNPSHLITLGYSLFLALVPIVPQSATSDLPFEINELISLAVALMLCNAGWRAVKTLGGILLLSYPYSDYDYHVLKSSIIDKVLNLEAFKLSYTIEKFFAAKLNFELFVVGMKIMMKGGSDDDATRLRFEISRVIRKSIEEADSAAKRNKGKVDITIDIDR